MTKSEKYLSVTTILAALHAVDHILRVDHSGWPFRAGVSPFTYSLISFPLLVSIYMANRGSWYRVISTAALFVFATLAHILFEPLRDKYHTWTFGSDMPSHIGQSNLLGIHSPLLGVYSITLAVLLSILLLLTTVSFYKDVN